MELFFKFCPVQTGMRFRINTLDMRPTACNFEDWDTRALDQDGSGSGRAEGTADKMLP